MSSRCEGKEPAVLRMKAGISFGPRYPFGAKNPVGCEAVAVADEAVTEDCDVLMPRGPMVPEEMVFGEVACEKFPGSARIGRSPP